MDLYWFLHKSYCTHNIGLTCVIISVHFFFIFLSFFVIFCLSVRKASAAIIGKALEFLRFPKQSFGACVFTETFHLLDVCKGGTETTLIADAGNLHRFVCIFELPTLDKRSVGTRALVHAINAFAVSELDSTTTDALEGC